MKSKPLLVYFAQQPKERHRYELYYNGKPSGEFICASQIRDVLSPDQYREFLSGVLIFEIQKKITIPETKQPIRTWVKRNLFLL